MTRPGRLAVAAAVALTVLVAAIAWRAERLVGGDADDGHAVIDVTLPAGVAVEDVVPVWRGRLGAVRFELAAAADHVTVTVPLAADRPPVAAAAMLARPGTLAFVWVASDTETAAAWFRAIQAAPVVDGVHAEIDAWQDEASGRHHRDYYLAGPSAQAIVDRLAQVAPAVPVPPDLDLVFEAAATPDTGPPVVRTYLIERSAILTGDDIAGALATWDPNTNRPQVMVNFTPRGQAAFAEATAAGIGRKLAILVDDAVSSAPVVQGAIRGGRVSITVGIGSRAAMEAEAQALAAMLRQATGGALPHGITATVRSTEVGDPAHAWLGRVLLAAAAGALAFLLAPLVARGGLAWAPLAHGGGRPAWGPGSLALAVSVGVPLGLRYLAGEVPLPGLPDAIFDVVGPRGSAESVGVFALGIMPLVAATLLVELIALAVPAWRARRLGTAAERRSLDRAVAWLTLGLAALQSYFIAGYLAQLAQQLDAPLSALEEVVIVLSLVTGTLVTLQAARAISRWGLANGVVVLLGAASLRTLIQVIPDRPDDPRWAAIGALAVVGGVATLLTNLRPPRGRRLPWGGLVPAMLPAAVAVAAAVPLGLYLAGSRGSLADLMRLLTERSFGFDAAFAALALGAIGWARYRDWQPVPAVVSMLFTALVVASPLLVEAPLRTFVAGAGGATIGILAVELAVGAWARLRLVDPTAVLIVHDVERADRACDRLSDAGIACAAPGLRVRALFRLFAAYCPIVVVVARADVAAATAALADAPAALTDAAGALPAGPPADPPVG